MEITSASHDVVTARYVCVSGAGHDSAVPDLIAVGMLAAKASAELWARGLVPVVCISATSSHFEGRWAHCVYLDTVPGEGGSPDLGPWFEANLPGAWDELGREAFLRWVAPDGPAHNDSMEVH